MKKVFVVAAAVIAAMSMNAEKLQVVGRDTIVYRGAYELKQDTSVNAFGESRIVRKVVLSATDSFGKEKTRKFIVSKETYAGLKEGAQIALVYTTYEDGSEKITKVVTKTTK